ncbi:hypothetical protein [Sulfitobacter sp.]|uniref:hypothetical protein n=1 Tax=Sulfitobacter sp. TaxID=1903071 RepID=UPI0030026728
MTDKTGILKKLANDPSITKGKLSNVANDDLDDFLARFRAAGKPVRKPSDGMINTIEASLVARVPATDIVRFVLEGRLACVETGCENFASAQCLSVPQRFCQRLRR